MSDIINRDEFKVYVSNDDQYIQLIIKLNDTYTKILTLSNSYIDYTLRVFSSDGSFSEESIWNHSMIESEHKLPAYYSQGEWGYIHRCGRMATLVLHANTDRQYADNTEQVIAVNVPIIYMPYSSEFTFANGNWDNDNINIIKVSFKDNGNGTCDIYLIPLKGNIATNSYIYGVVNYICLS